MLSQNLGPEYKDNYLTSLRKELIQLVEEQLTPIALKYQYSSHALEEKIRWRPVVLVLGNYSSGKSTLINELLGSPVQTTGQAPTDDCFTVITKGDKEEVENRDGGVLLGSDEYPFAPLKVHGQRFASHFRLKKVRSPFLDHLALIDTPGMLDSIAERDRGYDYQQVLGDLAGIADLILVLFDPHKAGTIRETWQSLRETLPAATWEDRVLFVLNRVDECTNINDLLRVYGTLCWNLSQMTGRKDIPPIHLTWSEAPQSGEGRTGFLSLLENQREELRRRILQAPRHRLDHLITYIEEHSDGLSHLLETLMNYGRKRRVFLTRMVFVGLVLSVGAGGGFYWGLAEAGLIEFVSPRILPAVGTFGGILFFVIWWLAIRTLFLPVFHQNRIRDLDDLTPLNWQSHRDSWLRIKHIVQAYLESSGGSLRFRQLRHDLRVVRTIRDRAGRDARRALEDSP